MVGWLAGSVDWLLVWCGVWVYLTTLPPKYYKEKFRVHNAWRISDTYVILRYRRMQFVMTSTKEN